MGIIKRIADNIRSREGDGEKMPLFGKRPKKESIYRKSSFMILHMVSRADLAKVLEDLVSRGIVAKEEIESSLEAIVDETSLKARAAMEAGKLLEPEKQEKLLATVKARFEEHSRDPQWKALQKRRKGIAWEKVEARLRDNPEKIWSLNQMEETGGEPDVVGYDRKTGEYVFWDLSKNIPIGRSKHCYDAKGQKQAEKQGEHPDGNAIEKAAEMGIRLLNESEYRQLHVLGRFDNWTFNWIETPDKVRITGCALAGSSCFNAEVRVFQFPAKKHDDMMGFRGSLRV
jgi:hypothetical protein